MRTITFQSLTEGALERYGQDPDSLPLASRLALGGYVTDAVKKCWAFRDWEELCPIEERALRDVYSNARQYYVGDEVYDLDSKAYYRATEVTLGHAPTEIAYWDKINPDPWLAKAQTGQTIMDQVFGLWVADPRIEPRSRKVAWMDRGDHLYLPGRCSPGNTVWIKYRMPAPKFSYRPLVEATAYRAGDVRFHAEDGECYRALTATTGATIGDATKWERQPIPYIFETPLKLYLVADLQAEDSQQADAAVTRTLADDSRLDVQDVVAFQTNALTV